MDAPKNDVPSADQIEPRTTINARGYGQWVMIYQRTSGESDFMKSPFLVKSHVPITPAEAEARAAAFLTDDDNTYNRVTLGVGYMGTELFTPQE